VTEIVVLSGNPRAGSRTRALAESVGDALAKRRNAATPIVVDLADNPEPTGALATVRAAGLLVVATPTYKGSYTGVLKVFLDNLPHLGLAGVTAVPVTVGANEQQAAQSGRHLRGLLAELGADVRPGLAVTEAQLTDAAIAARYADELA
jgi:FMN reductase